MVSKNFSYFLNILCNYHLLSQISFIVFLYALFDIYRGYFEENTKTLKPCSSETCTNSTYPFCNTSDDVQFSSFILLALDGVSYHYIQPLLDLFGKNAQLYRTVTDLNKFTQAIVRTWLTGRENTKFQPFKIEEDNIMLSYNRTYGIKLYIGGILNLFKAGTVKPYNTLFAYMDPFINKMDVNTLRPFVKWLGRKEKINNLLQLCKDNNYSLMLYDDGTDHVQHYQGATTLCSNFSLSQKIPERLCEDILPVKEFIDKNNNFVLIVCSDHGHDEAFYEDNIKKVELPYFKSFTPESHWRYYDHGGYIVNNTGWWMFYSPLLSPSYRTINITDVASTWMKYIKNVDIPANNIGRPMNSMKYIRNEIKVKQQGLAQMWNLCRKSTKFCEGKVYEEGLEWKEGSINEMEEKRLKGKEELREKELNLVKNMVSFNPNELFPYNLSVNELIRISEGRDKIPRRKVKMNITTHYYYEYDMDENGNLFDSLIEENEKLNITKEKAKEIINQYNLFINESERLHNLLYDTLTIIKHSDYYSMGKNVNYLSQIIFYFSFIIDIILFYIIIRNYTKYYFKNNNKKIHKLQTQRKINKYINILLLFFVCMYGRIFYFSFSRMKTMMEYLSQPEVHVATFRSYYFIHSLYGRVANYICVYTSFLLFIILLKLLITCKKMKGIVNYRKNEMKKNSFIFFIYLIYDSFNSSSSSPQYSLYSLYIHPILKLIMVLIFLPLIFPYVFKVRHYEKHCKSLKTHDSTPSYSAMKINIVFLFLSSLDIILSIIIIIVNHYNEKRGKSEKYDIINKDQNKEKERNLYWDLFDKICYMVIFYNHEKFTDINIKNRYTNGFDVNMLIIVLFTLFLYISEMMKKKRRINIVKNRPPSLLNFLIEIKSSWSLINSFRSCIANSPYIIVIIIIISLFLSDRLFHFPVFFIYSLFLLYILLPVIYAIITRITYYLNFEDKQRNDDNDGNWKEYDDEEEENEINSLKGNNNNGNKKCIIKYLFILLVDWTEIILCFITLHLVAEYISFSYYSWLYSVRENASFSVCNNCTIC